MRVRLIGLTMPVIPEVETPQQLLAYCARVSSTANQENHSTGGRLIRSLITRKEWSPLEMLSLLFEVETTRDIGRQMLRHDIRPQEFSQRYAEVASPYVLRECRMQHPTDRQMSLPCTDPALAEEWARRQAEVIDVADRTYRWALRRGIAKECARAPLPEGNTPTRLYFNGFLRNWIHYCAARVEPAAQKEHRDVAEPIFAIILEHFPVLKEALA